MTTDQATQLTITPVDETEQLMTIDDVSTYLQIPKRTLHDWRTNERPEDQGPPAYRLGRFLRYRRADVDAWIDQQIAGSSRAA
ncbi:excisionase family DNA binding protein [Aeromicrobium panaciterrae]|uniref:Excisionase family DNA binding protein n=1 Tax=Aeromicrobium panaciterrae TaxID=363861 RepID=A0ABU1UNR0_9ACTN|nr:helix-turn-helix domain-containing protein [Aeromicrobium panaciterrae]MDR7086823.1 excisionase family DNA binding protein [Aeromicrobium panaciterrae]